MPKKNKRHHRRRYRQQVEGLLRTGNMRGIELAIIRTLNHQGYDINSEGKWVRVDWLNHVRLLRRHNPAASQALFRIWEKTVASIQPRRLRKQTSRTQSHRQTRPAPTS